MINNSGMKNYFPLSLFFIGFFAVTSCEDPETEMQSSSYKLNAVVENGNNYNNSISKVKAIIDYGNVEFDVAEAEYKNGGFELTLPAVLPENMLIDLTDKTFEYSESVYRLVSDKNAKFMEIGIFAYNDSEGNDKLYNFQCVSKEETSFSMGFLYADRDFSMRGRLKNGDYYYAEGVDYIHYEADFKKGWNVVYFSGNLITTQKPENVEFKWMYTGQAALDILEYEHYKYVDANQKVFYLRFKDNKYIMSFDSELKAVDFNALYEDYINRTSWSSLDKYRVGVWVVADDNILVFGGRISPLTANSINGGAEIKFAYLNTPYGYEEAATFSNY